MGGTNSYNKYTIPFESVNELYYICIMKTVILLNMIVAYLTIISALLIGVSMMILKYFPTSKLSSFIRRHFLTDEDLEPPI